MRGDLERDPVGAELERLYAERGNWLMATIELEFGDRYGAARVYHNLGMVAQQQWRFAEAEAHYRQALDIHQESDPRKACSTSLMLGIMLARLDRHQDAIHALLYTAVTWHRQTGHWDNRALSWLHREYTLTEVISAK